MEDVGLDAALSVCHETCILSSSYFLTPRAERWRGACREIWVAGKLTSAELNASVPDIYSCKCLINYWCICRTYDVLVDRFGGGEASHLHRYHPKFSTDEPKMPGEYIFVFLKLSFIIFMVFLRTAICKMDSGYKALTICSCSGANSGRGFDVALERCPLCGLHAWVDVGIKY